MRWSHQAIKQCPTKATIVSEITSFQVKGFYTFYRDAGRQKAGLLGSVYDSVWMGNFSKREAHMYNVAQLVVKAGRAGREILLCCHAAISGYPYRPIYNKTTKHTLFLLWFCHSRQAIQTMYDNIWCRQQIIVTLDIIQVVKIDLWM